MLLPWSTYWFHPYVPNLAVFLGVLCFFCLISEKNALCESISFLSSIFVQRSYLEISFEAYLTSCFNINGDEICTFTE